MAVPWPFSCVGFKSIEHPCLDALKHHAVGSFYLPVTLWVCHRSVANFYAEFFAPIFEFYAYELSAIICDNLDRDAASDNNILEEFLCFGSCDRGDRFGFNPFGEFVIGDKEMCKTTRCSLQRADHVKTPDCK